ncbi:hypothetical protein HD553DRAFT_76960 [Filobasidium floriforme]|uniref:uncharacterized protein n=1 Tax=Filobasidium floriforme TaxID=5210 RepID=UPI001E8CB7F3|nr:uncharacterized protein HD553DRAFT_76960 [Filobasidium floriforme]KAH8081890.1 hypothetical protein HD553DRAFT_76960 [Filobasidium floriforme]
MLSASFGNSGITPRVSEKILVSSKRAAFYHITTVLLLPANFHTTLLYLTISTRSHASRTKYPFPSSFIVAVVALSHCMTYISGSPVPGDAGTDDQSQGPKCNISPRPNNPDRYLYTGKGRPSPSDLKVSNLWLPWPRGVEVNPEFAENKTGVPADLSSFAVMRSLVELDIQNIEKLLPYDDSKGNKDCFVHILGYKVEEIGTFAVTNYDRFK